nr:PREDICTED: putative IQ motif and ankyrin repeat domain-containing protein LOC642574 homolog isoform X1 [Lepisosteus oculatus]XP_015212679.1 PREDICTED: putative IQ motif and ankyrin repeat domain-containing protein LOC642574 homolog isoform X1 [Lepisosteus oculatus]
MNSSKAKAIPAKGVGKVSAKGPVQTKKTGQKMTPKGNTVLKNAAKSPSKTKDGKKGPATPSSAELGDTGSRGRSELSPEERAAVTIQCAVRQLLARGERERRERERKKYEELMDQLQKESLSEGVLQAFLALVRREQEEAERERKREEEERKRRQEEQRRRTRLLEAAFEGEAEEILAVLKEVSDLETKQGVGFDEAGRRQRLLSQLRIISSTDAHGNTALSEAAGGGQSEIITLLMERGADVNTKGGFGRTPLYRAAFGGHLSAVQTLLQLGADPRIHADDGSTPEQVASGNGIALILQGWDLKATDAMLEKMEAEKQRRVIEEQRQREAEADRLKSEVQQLEKEHERCQKELQKAYCELNKRISEHDKCERKGLDRAQLTLPAIGEAEQQLERVREEAQRAEEQLSLARLELREQAGEGAVAERGAVHCLVRELDDVLLKDVGGRIQQDGRWPLLIDPSGQAATFLRYRDTNYLDALNPEHMQPEVLRVALLGAIRFGKPLVINMMEADVSESVKNQMNQIQAGLMDQLMNKKLLQNERYLILVRPSDGPQYSKTEFSAARTEKFSFVLVTKLRSPPEALLTAFYPIDVTLPRPQL